MVLALIARTVAAAEPAPEADECVCEERRPPLETWLPLGVPQLVDAAGRRGWRSARCRRGAGVGSLLVYADLSRRAPFVPEHSGDRPPPGLRTEKYALQWPLTALFWGGWVGSALEARAHWRAERRITESSSSGRQLVVLPVAADTVGLGAVGTF